MLSEFILNKYLTQILHKDYLEKVLWPQLPASYKYLRNKLRQIQYFDKIKLIVDTTLK